METSSAPPTGFGSRLVARGLLTDDQLREATRIARTQRISFITQLVQSKLVNPTALAEIAATEFHLPLADLNAFTIDIAPYPKLTERLLRMQHALPLLQRGKKLYVAISDPTNLHALDELKFATALATEAILVEENKLAAAIDRAATTIQSASLGMDEADLENIEVVKEGDERDEEGAASAEDAPIVRYVNKILMDAIGRGASDVHFEPYEKNYRIRLRVDGVLYQVATPPTSMGPRLAARIKVLARMDLTERRKPQDGRMKLRLSPTKSIDFRVNTLPTLWGEKIVARILDSSSAQLGIDALGYEPEQKAKYLKALHRPQGMILITGPTGSGKTVSLYTGLNILNTEGVNISTAEDPAEINLPGVNQVNINTRVDLTFANALRAFLRQDPDVIMVGEIRDLETASIAIKAAQTGHMVLSTLHTNDAPKTLTRLLNMGVPAYNIASTVTLIIAQRLARKLCPLCKRHAQIPRDELIREGFGADEVDTLEIFQAVGCSQCSDGYKGRTGLYQVMEISETMGRLIMEGANAITLADQARKEGVHDLRASALRKVRAGIIDLTEANRVTVD
ncbi:MAG: type IV-A pilus assembly ATPase PilB [Nevskiaceae bacterium]|nr:MAG: type IV-A pilus assembly ATPase PilB [Nevskiaceae bacterium]TBR72083.1 MAG: type IV-A pilus assembly ATPase PilB [Nevskiaceae bacterium]